MASSSSSSSRASGETPFTRAFISQAITEQLSSLPVIDELVATPPTAEQWKSVLNQISEEIHRCILPLLTTYNMRQRTLPLITGNRIEVSDLINSEKKNNSGYGVRSYKPLQEIKAITITNEGFCSLTKEINLFSSLTNLTLDCHLLFVPDTLGNLKTLISLNLSGNRLEDLPESIRHLTNLSELDVSNNNFSIFPLSITFLSNLKRLEFNNNKLQEVPDEILGLQDLIVLRLSHNNFRRFPSALSYLMQLSDVDLSNNFLWEIPSSFVNAKRLQTLNLERNRYNVFPKIILGLTYLQNLNLNHNQLPILPDELGALTSLCVLKLSGNSLIDVTPQAGCLTRLQILDLSNNHIEEIPSQIGSLTQLENCNLSHNRISTVPKEMSGLARMSKLFLEFNPCNKSVVKSRRPPSSFIDISLKDLFLFSWSRITNALEDSDSSANRVKTEDTFSQLARRIEYYYQRWVLENQTVISFYQSPDGGLYSFIEFPDGQQSDIAVLEPQQTRSLTMKAIEHIRNCTPEINNQGNIEFVSVSPIYRWFLSNDEVLDSLGSGCLSLIERNGTPGALSWSFYADKSRQSYFANDVFNTSYIQTSTVKYKTLKDCYQEELETDVQDKQFFLHDLRHYRIRVGVKKYTPKQNAEVITRVSQLLYVQLIPRTYPSRLDPNIQISRWKWAVALISVKPGPLIPSHAEILIEKLTGDGLSYQIAHLTASNSNRIARGSCGKAGRAKVSSPFDFKDLTYESISKVWVRSARRIRSLLSKIESKSREPVPFNLAGRGSIINYDGSHNCITWAKAQLMHLNINLPDQLSDIFYVHPSQYQKEK